MSQVNVEPRKAPEVPWRIELPPKPKEPEIFAQIKGKVDWWYLITILALFVEIGSWVCKWYTSSFIVYLVITGILTATCALVLWTPITRWIPELLPSMRQARKQYKLALEDHGDEVNRLVSRLKFDARQSLFPLCTYQLKSPMRYGTGTFVCWRTGSEPEDTTNDTFSHAKFQGSINREVFFPECYYKFDNGKFQWGDTVIIRSPEFL